MLSIKQIRVYPKNRNPKKIIENLTLQLEIINKVAQQLDHLESKLNEYDSESAYNNVHLRLIEEYNVAKARYKAVETLRKARTIKGACTEEQAAEEKAALVKHLDPVVNTLNKDFSVCAEEKYLLLDEIFLLKTNSHLRCDFDKMNKMVDSVVRNHEKILEEELRKMKRIHNLLDDEERRLSIM